MWQAKFVLLVAVVVIIIINFYYYYHNNTKISVQWIAAAGYRLSTNRCCAYQQKTFGAIVWIIFRLA